MTRKSNIKKYEQILERLAKGETQASIVIAEKCSYGTISAAIKWDKNGRPITIPTSGSKSTNRTKIVISIPNYWLERLNDDIVAGSWIDYSDAIVDIIRTHFRTRMEPHTHSQIESRRSRGTPMELRKEIMGDLKEFISPESIRGFFRTYYGDDDTIPKERAAHRENRKSEIMKERDLIKSRFKELESENYTFSNYHGQPLIKEEYEVLLELEQQVGEIPKWDFTLGENVPEPRELSKFSYVLFGNYIIGLMIADKGLTFLPQSINQLKFVQILYLPNNQLTELPESIGQLEYLEEVNLQDNALKSLPESIGELTNLRILHLENNDLTTLPETICNLKTWFPIGLSNNKIGSLSEKILKMCMPQAKVTIAAKYQGIRKKIQCELDLVGNPIMNAKK